MNKRGFTLIELLIVIAIIGALAAVSVTAYIGTTKKAARTEAYNNLESLRLLEEQFYAENGAYAPIVAGAINYTATDPPAANTIESVFRGFKPGGCLNCASPYGLDFTYSITSTDSNFDGLADRFTATATGVAGTRVAGDSFTINWQNIRNF